jgi:uncharacterized protein (DUF927 family)
VSRRKQPYKYGVPAKYLSGLSEADAKKRAREILATAAAYIKKVQKSRVSDKKKKR